MSLTPCRACGANSHTENNCPIMDPTLLKDAGPTSATATASEPPKQKVRIIAPGIDISMDLDAGDIERVVSLALKIAAAG